MEALLRLTNGHHHHHHHHQHRRRQHGTFVGPELPPKFKKKKKICVRSIPLRATAPGMLETRDITEQTHQQAKATLTRGSRL